MIHNLTLARYALFAVGVVGVVKAGFDLFTPAGGATLALMVGYSILTDMQTRQALRRAHAAGVVVGIARTLSWAKQQKPKGQK